MNNAEYKNVQSAGEEPREWDVRTEDMPSSMQILLADYPRDIWKAHPGFKDKTEQWLGAHQSFKRLIASLRKDTELFLDGSRDARDFGSRLAYRGSILVGNLHGHHSWEDHSYFPELSAADSRFDAGLAILEKDHAVLHQVLDRFTEHANHVLRLTQLDKAKARDDAGKLHSVSETIESLLHRHLGDEEELAVPIILHHRLRG